MSFGVFWSCTWTDAHKSLPDMFYEHIAEMELADKLGFDTLWVPEHHFIDFVVCPSPFQFLSKISSHVKRARLGAAVSVMPFYHPLRFAGEAALCDIFTEGRLELGVARGAFEYEFARLGIAESDSKEVFREALECVTEIWAKDEEVSHNGKYFQYENTYVLPRPVQKPHPPLWIGSISPETIEWAVQQGHNLLYTSLRDTAEKIGDAIGLVEDVLKEQQKPRDSIKVGISRLTYVAETDAEARRMLPYIVDTTRQLYTLFLYADKAQVRNGRVSATSFPNEPTEEELYGNLPVGDPERVIDMIQEIVDYGADHVILFTTLGQPTELVQRSLTLFAEKVMPRIRFPRRTEAQQPVVSAGVEKSG